MNTKVSIVTPSYNSGKYIEKTIQSVISQTYEDWEMIIIDDSSSDNSVDLIKEFCKKEKRIKLLVLDENVGSGRVRNLCIEKAEGRFIAFLDSDDYWSPNKLEKQVNYMIENDYSFTYTQYYEIEDATNQLKNLVKSPIKVNYKKILQNDYIGCLTAMYDTEKLGKRYMPEIRKRQDWVLWIRILKDIDWAYGIQEPLAYYRTGIKSLSNNKFKLLKHNYNVYKKELKFNHFTSAFYFVNFLIHYFTFKFLSVKKLD
jgi:teichuronic acid biosynthesis glycosyltransferase TuaG